MSYIITIPTKNRPYIQKTLKGQLRQFKKDDIFLFVEPQEYEKYFDMWNSFANIIKLDKNNMGIGYGRNFIVNWCVKNKKRYVFMIDDNIKVFYRRESEPTPAGWFKLHLQEDVKKIFDDMFHIMVHGDINPVQVGLPYRPNAWSYKEHIKFDTRLWACFLFDIKKLYENEINFDVNLQIAEDFDLCINIIKKSLRNAMFFDYAFGKEMGTDVGGNNDFYKNKEEIEKQIDYLVNKHPNIVKKIFKEKRNMCEIKVRWSDIK